MAISRWLGAARAAARAAAPAAGRALDQERRQPAVPRHPHRIQERIPATAEVSQVLWRHASSSSSALRAKAHMLASRSELAVSTVIAASTGPLTAMQAWPGASP